MHEVRGCSSLDGRSHLEGETPEARQMGRFASDQGQRGREHGSEAAVRRAGTLLLP